MRTITALFVGLGSIGTRHLKNLTNLCADRGWTLQADALRSDLSRPLRDGVAALLHAQYTDLADAPAHYDMVFITNPTSLHADALTRVRGRGGALFIEKPIFSADQTGLDLADCLPAGQKAYVAAPMRWCGVMLALKDRLPGLHPYCARVICSSYLPDWRPGVDYRTVYSAHKAMGGGVTIDLIHEWDYLVELFGVPEKLYNFKGTYSDLEIDSDDLSVYIARYPTLLAEVHLDYFGRGYRRSIELFCHDGSYLADFGAGTLTLPDGTGFDFCREVRRTSGVPILFLTASDEEMDIITGLDLGGDDYITKPFKLGVLLSRVHALLRRAGGFGAQQATELCSGGIRVDLLAGRAEKNGVPLELTAAEYKLLCLFLRSPGQVLTKETILNALWDCEGNYVDTNTLTVYIRRLRLKVEDDPGSPQRLVTVRGMGYRWNGDV